jgi:hypothetical protein
MSGRHGLSRGMIVGGGVRLVWGIEVRDTRNSWSEDIRTR